MESNDKAFKFFSNLVLAVVVCIPVPGISGEIKEWYVCESQTDATIQCDNATIYRKVFDKSTIVGLEAESKRTKVIHLSKAELLSLINKTTTLEVTVDIDEFNKKNNLNIKGIGPKGNVLTRDTLIKLVNKEGIVDEIYSFHSSGTTSTGGHSSN